MQFQYGKAPLNYINGIPAHKAGEWPGIHSCKFENTRRMIHPKPHGIIFNGNSLLITNTFISLYRKRATSSSTAQTFIPRSFPRMAIPSKH